MSDSPIAGLERFAANRHGVFTLGEAIDQGVGRRTIDRCIDSERNAHAPSRLLRHRGSADLPPARAGRNPVVERPCVSHHWRATVGARPHHHQRGACDGRAWSQSRHPDVVVHRAEGLIPADIGLVHGIPVTSALRTVLDLAACIDPLALELAIEDALRRMLFTLGQLRWRVEDHCGMGVPGATAIRKLLEAHLGDTDSGWELRVARILTAAGFPEPQRQVKVTTADGPKYLDLGYPGPPPVAFEYDSDLWLFGVRRRHLDAARRNALRLAGVTVIEITSDLAADPARLVKLIGPAIRDRRRFVKDVEPDSTDSVESPTTSWRRGPKADRWADEPEDRTVAAVQRVVTPCRYPYAMGVGKPRGLSPSSFSAFKDCPLAFRFSYLDRLPQPPSAAASKGTLVHRALELLMLRGPAARTIANALVDLDTARTELASHPDFADLDLTVDEWDRFHAEAEVLVRKYFELEDPTTIVPIGLELRLAATIGSVQLRGIIDRLEIDADGELVITDYKTGSVPGERYEIKRLAGVHMYAAMVAHVLGKRPVKVQLFYLSKPEAIITSPSEQSITGVMRKTDALWSAIGRACERDDFRPSTGPLCNWCSYKPYCPAYGGDPLQAVELLGPGQMIEPTLALTDAERGLSPADGLIAPTPAPV